MREDQRAATRTRIVRAVSDLVAEEHPASISVPAVAARAGLGVATVYRYFPTKEALLDAAAAEVVTPDVNRLPGSMDEIGTVLADLWGELVKQLPLVRNQWASPVGRELHRRRWASRRALMEEAARRSGLEPESEEAQRAMATVDVLTSSSALLELHDKAGIDPERAAEWCAWAVRVLWKESMR